MVWIGRSHESRTKGSRQFVADDALMPISEMMIMTSIFGIVPVTVAKKKKIQMFVCTQNLNEKNKKLQVNTRK